MRETLLAILAAVLSIVAVVVIYVGSYFAMLDPFELGFSGGGETVVVRFPAYRVAHDHATWFYSPLGWIDRKLRPTYWREPLPDMPKKSLSIQVVSEGCVAGLVAS